MKLSGTDKRSTSEEEIRQLKRLRILLLVCIVFGALLLYMLVEQYL